MFFLPHSNQLRPSLSLCESEIIHFKLASFFFPSTQNRHQTLPALEQATRPTAILNVYLYIKRQRHRTSAGEVPVQTDLIKTCLLTRKSFIIWKKQIPIMKFLSSAILVASLATSAFGSIVYVGGSIAGPPAASFTGSLEYNFTSSSAATLIVSLANTSPIANGGYLTAFAFNNPGDAITGATLTSYAAGTGPWVILGAPDFTNEFTASPLGVFDIGAVVGDADKKKLPDWEGGGDPKAGVPVSATGTWTFTLTGTGLNALTAASFIAETAPEKVDKDGDVKTAGTEVFAVRFRGFVDGKSAKVPGEEIPPPTNVVPEPAHYTLALGSAALLLALRRRRAAKK